MADLDEVEAVLFGVLLAFAVAGACLTPLSIGDIVALFKRPPHVQRRGGPQ